MRRVRSHVCLTHGTTELLSTRIDNEWVERERNIIKHENENDNGYFSVLCEFYVDSKNPSDLYC